MYRKKIVLSSFLIIFVVFSTIQFVSYHGTIDRNNEDNYPIFNEFDEIPNPSNPDLSDDITGTGANQTVRVFMSNSSTSNNYHGHFNITAPISDSYLSYGDFIFSLQNNYTTDHVLEGDNALDLASYINYDINETLSNITIWDINNKSTHLSSDDEILNGTVGAEWILNSTDTYGVNGVNFTIYANFSGQFFTNNEKIYFNRTDILGFFYFLEYNLTAKANLTIEMYNFYNSKWENITNFVQKEIGLGRLNITERVINKNLNYTDMSNCTRIRFNFTRTNADPFNVTLYDFNMISVYAFDVPITNTSYPALGFELHGSNSTVNGFYAWIRTLDLAQVTTTKLNISLYRANATLDPDYSQLIDNKTLIMFQEDSLYYIPLNIANTSEMNNSLYFLVIKSNVSNEVYSLVGIPTINYGDGVDEHPLKIYYGDSWIDAPADYESGKLDASSFKINITRGYMPSDFNDTLKIQNETLIVDYTDITSGPPYIEWGLGRWNHNFTFPIKSNLDQKFRVNLTWNTSLIYDFEFDVNYTAAAYRDENATTTYSVNYDESPEWYFNYYFNLSHSKFDFWNFTELWYVYLNDFNASMLTNPNGQDKFSQTSGEIPYLADNRFDKVVVSSDIVDKINGSYILNLTSPNIVSDSHLHSYINFNGTLWETSGFMNGDNISVSLDIQDQNNVAPKSGNASVILFYPNGTEYNELESTTGEISHSYNTYTFNNDTILNINDEFPLASNFSDKKKYVLGFFWTNGSSIGCKTREIHIDDYEVSIMNLKYYPEDNHNVLQGSVNKLTDNYSLLVASVRDITGVSLNDFYAVNNPDVNATITYQKNGEFIPIQVKTFMQNETIINPGEKVNFKFSLQNRHSSMDIDVKASIKLVSLANEDWVISESISSLTTLKLKGDPSGNDTKEFVMNVTIPVRKPDNIWYGLNSPVRKAGAKSIITLYVEGNVAGTYESNNYSLIVNITDDLFEGYVLSLKYLNPTTSNAISTTFNRDECLYTPLRSTFVVNVYDYNFMSTQDSILKQFSIKTDTEFRNITTSIEHPRNGQFFNLSSILTSEFGSALKNKKVSCQYYFNGSWVQISSNLTDSEGITTFSINTSALTIENDLLLRLIWPGNSYFIGNYRNISVDLINQLNSLSISYGDEINFLYRNKVTLLPMKLRNSGNSTLKVYNISVDIEGDIKLSIVSLNYIELNEFESGETIDFSIEVDVPNILQDHLNISISVDAKNVITNENVAFKETKSLPLVDLPLTEYLLGVVVFILVGILALTLILSVAFVRKTIKTIETPVEVREKRRPKRARYVKVTELEKEELEPEKEETEKIKKSRFEKLKSKKKEKPKEIKELKEEKTVDLDSLLEDEGLDDSND